MEEYEKSTIKSADLKNYSVAEIVAGQMLQMRIRVCRFGLKFWSISKIKNTCTPTAIASPRYFLYEWLTVCTTIRNTRAIVLLFF